MLGWIRGPKIAWLGAFITVVALAVDPFTQNIVSTNSCPILSTNRTITMPTASEYDTYVTRQVKNDTGEFVLWGRPWYSLNPAMKIAIYSGLSRPATTVGNTSRVDIACPGSNCTFPRYTTMGVCHKCADITSSIKKSCDEPASDAGNETQSACTWALPNGQSLQSYTDESVLFRPPSGGVPLQNFAMVNSTVLTQVLGNIPGTFSNVSILANTSSDTSCTIDRPDACLDLPIGYPRMPFNTIAVECSLFPCARTYTAAVVDGMVLETEVKRTLGEGVWTTTFSRDGEPRPLDIVIDPHEACERKSSSGTDSLGPCTYAATSGFVEAAARHYWQFWNGTVSGRQFREGVPSTEVLEVLYNRGVTNYTYIDETLGSVADAMTTAMRSVVHTRDLESRGWGGQGVVSGEVYVLDTCVSVRWGWIVLPAAVVGTSLGLLVAMLVSSGGKGAGVWKASALPVLFHGLSAETRDSEQVATVGEMGREAKGLRVALRGNRRGGWGLEQTT